MYRARPWTVVVLVVVTGVVVGFARLRDLAPSVPPVPQPTVEEHDDAADDARCLDELVKNLEGLGLGCDAGKPIPPLWELPPLPSELCPPDSVTAQAPSPGRPF